jgi:hypothetical protein
MPDSEVSIAERVKSRLVENLGDQAHVFENHDLRAFANRDSRRLLPTVLQGVKPEVGELGDLFVRSPDAEDATCILRPTILGIYVVVQQAISLCHCLMVTVRTRHHCQLEVLCPRGVHESAQ